MAGQLFLMVAAFFLAAPAIASASTPPPLKPEVFQQMLGELVSESERNPDRQLAVALLYARGINGRPDYPHAFEWCQKAAEGGNTSAMYLLAVMYMEGEGLGAPRDYAAAFRWARKLADKGDASGYMLLGMLYESGSGTEQSYRKAADAYGYATREFHDIGARYRMGMLNLEGRGMPQNTVHALEWLEAAAERGDLHAQYQLGLLYYEGKLVRADHHRAFQWFSRVNDATGDTGPRRLPETFGQALVKGEDYTKSMGQLMKKDPHIVRDARYRLALLHDEGVGAGTGQASARTYYEEAASAGQREARKKLAAIKKSEQEALRRQKLEEKKAEKARKAAEKEAEKKRLAEKAEKERLAAAEKGRRQRIAAAEKTAKEQMVTTGKAQKPAAAAKAAGTGQPPVVSFSVGQKGKEKVVMTPSLPETQERAGFSGSVMKGAAYSGEAVDPQDYPIVSVMNEMLEMLSERRTAVSGEN